VRDEGYGISKEDQSHIFDRFHRIRTEDNTKVEGLGLGLYVSHEIVRQHGGRMWVESQLGRGSTFYFSLPLNK
jgi:signal transduction histidine kinase